MIPLCNDLSSSVLATQTVSSNLLSVLSDTAVEASLQDGPQGAPLPGTHTAVCSLPDSTGLSRVITRTLWEFKSVTLKARL